MQDVLGAACLRLGDAAPSALGSNSSWCSPRSTLVSATSSTMSVSQRTRSLTSAPTPAAPRPLRETPFDSPSNPALPLLSLTPSGTTTPTMLDSPTRRSLNCSSAVSSHWSPAEAERPAHAAPADTLPADKTAAPADAASRTSLSRQGCERSRPGESAQSREPSRPGDSAQSREPSRPGESAQSHEPSRPGEAPQKPRTIRERASAGAGPATVSLQPLVISNPLNRFRNAPSRRQQPCTASQQVGSSSASPDNPQAPCGDSALSQAHVSEVPAANGLQEKEWGQGAQSGSMDCQVTLLTGRLTAHEERVQQLGKEVQASTEECRAKEAKTLTALNAVRTPCLNRTAGVTWALSSIR